MFARQPVPEGLIRLAAEQSGVVDREQVLGHGFSEAGNRRLLNQQVWRRLARGVYLTAAVDPTPWFALAWAGVLIGGDRARLGSADVLAIPCEVASEVAHNLILRGWPGPRKRCDRCRRVA